MHDAKHVDEEFSGVDPLLFEYIHVEPRHYMCRYSKDSFRGCAEESRHH